MKMLLKQESTLPAHASARQYPRRRGGFTLVEMLVVVIIIGILAAMILGLMRVVGTWSTKTQTTERLAKVRAAIEEYYAEYGKYPPVPEYSGAGQPFGYEYPITNGMNSPAYACFDVSATGATPWSTQPVFTFGLMSFLVTRYSDHAGNIHGPPDWHQLLNLHQWTDYNYRRDQDNPRDVAAIRRWTPYIADIIENRSASHLINNAPPGYTNAYLTVRDGWGNDLRYESRPPYQIYKLSSAGPDGRFGTDDDISVGPGQ